MTKTLKPETWQQWGVPRKTLGCGPKLEDQSGSGGRRSPEAYVRGLCSKIGSRPRQSPQEPCMRIRVGWGRETGGVESQVQVGELRVPNS